jgi:hypothetical protein
MPTPLPPQVADTDYNWIMTYGGWGLSHAAHKDGRVFVSTFHRAAVFDPSHPPRFRHLSGCSTSVSALVSGVMFEALTKSHFSTPC